MTKAELEQRLEQREEQLCDANDRIQQLEGAVQALYRKIGELVVSLDVARAQP